jgi:hypothetical protein
MCRLYANTVPLTDSEHPWVLISLGLTVSAPNKVITDLTWKTVLEFSMFLLIKTYKKPIK